MSNSYSLFARHEWESDEMYDLRKKFIKKYCNVPQYVANPNRLLCLAQLLINVRFLACSYNEELMKQVLDMAQNVDSNQPCNSAPVYKSGHIDTADKLNGMNKDGQRIKRRANDFDDAPPAGNEPLVKREAGDRHQSKSIADQKLDTILRLRAHLPHTFTKKISPERSIDYMNAACLKCKLDWRVDAVDSASIDGLSLFKLIVGDVLVLQSFHYSADRCKVRRAICRKAIEILRATEKLRVVEKTADNSYELAYNGGKNPSDWQYEILSDDLKSLGVYLREKTPSLYTTIRKNNKTGRQLPEEPINVLRLACEQLFGENGLFDVKKKRVEGWSEDAIVRVCKVEIARIRLQRKTGDHQAQLELMSSLCSKCIDEISTFDKFALNFECQENSCKLIPPTSQLEQCKRSAVDKIAEKFPNYEEMFALLRQNMPVADKCPNAVATLYECVSRSKLSLECTDDVELGNQDELNAIRCDAILEDFLRLARGNGKTKKAAKLDACQKAIDVILKNDLSCIVVL